MWETTVLLTSALLTTRFHTALTLKLLSFISNWMPTRRTCIQKLSQFARQRNDAFVVTHPRGVHAAEAAVAQGIARDGDD